MSRGPRVFVERIDIVGNTRTEDSVIRRQFHLAEGDPFNAGSLRRTEQRLKDLNYFGNVAITVAPGSAPDKAVLTTRVVDKATGQLSLGGGFSTDVGLLAQAGISESNLIGTGISAGLNGILAQKQSSIDLSVTDPYFQNRNLLLGGDLFLLQYNNLGTAPYDEKRVGFSVRAGYNFTNHLQQVWNYQLVGRTVYNIIAGSSAFIYDEAGYTLLSQAGQVLTLDYRDSTINPHRGYILSLSTDFAGLGGNAEFVRARLDGAYYIPLDYFTGDSQWDIRLRAGVGQLFPLGHQEQIIDRFFLGGDNLRGFQTGGVGPHDAVTGDSLGGRFIWTESTQLQFPAAGLAGPRPVGPHVRRCRRADPGQFRVQHLPEPAGRRLPGDQLLRCAAGRHRFRHLLAHRLRPDQHRLHAVRDQAAGRPDASLPLWIWNEVLVLHTRVLAAAGLGLALAATAFSPASAQQDKQWFIPGQHTAPRPAPPHPAAAPAPRPRRGRADPGRAQAAAGPQGAGGAARADAAGGGARRAVGPRRAAPVHRL